MNSTRTNRTSVGVALGLLLCTACLAVGCADGGSSPGAQGIRITAADTMTGTLDSLVLTRDGVSSTYVVNLQPGGETYIPLPAGAYLYSLCWDNGICEDPLPIEVRPNEVALIAIYS